MLPYLIAGVIGYGISKLFDDKKIPKYTDGGLIAPNGKPSNLSPEQYKLVRTPEFKAWFGDWENDPENASKVVDENGEPLVVYHGSPNEFFVFKIQERAYFFSKNKKNAENFVLSFKNVKDIEITIYNVFLNIRNLFNGKNLSEIEKEKIKIYVDNITNKQDLLFGVYWDDIKNDVEPNSDSDLVLDILNNTHLDSWHLIESYAFQKWLKSENYDGFLVSEIGFNNQNFGLYNSKNIKLADGTNTTFDGNNPDIRFMAGGKVDVVDIKQYNIGKRNYRFVEIAEKKYNKIELYRQADDGNYYGQLLYRGVPRYNAEFSSPMVNDMNQLYAYEPVSNEELFNAVKNKTKPFASFGYWLSYYTEEEIQKEIQSFIDECDKYDLEYAVEKISGKNKSLERIQFQVCQKGTFDELFDINALIEDYANNDFDSYDIEKLEEFRYVELSYFLNNEWDEYYALTGLILGIPPKFTMALINMWTSYGLRKKYQHTENIVVIKNNNTDIRFKRGGNLK